MTEAAVPPGVIAGAVAAARAYLRLESGAEEALLTTLAAGAIEVAEAFCGATLVVRDNGVWSDLPAPIAQGVVMLVAHQFGDRGGDREPPAAVSALWRPYRRVRLGAPA